MTLKLSNTKRTFELKSKGAIGIFSHGEMNTHKMVRVPDSVSITKQDYSIRGCFSVNFSRRRNDPYLLNETKKAIEDVKGCVDEAAYRDEMQGWIRDHPADKNGFSFRGSICPFHEKEKVYEEKIYTIDEDFQNIFFMVHIPPKSYIHVNLMDCSQKRLEKFFNRLGRLEEEDKPIITEFINERNNESTYYYRREINTTQLFKLIELSARCLNVYNVNILDKSCNVIDRRSERDGLRKYSNIYRRTIFPGLEDFVDVPNGNYNTKRKIEDISPVTKRKKTKRIQRTNTSRTKRTQRTSITKRTRTKRTPITTSRTKRTQRTSITKRTRTKRTPITTSRTKRTTLF